MPDPMETLIAHMDDTERLELARDVVHQCRIYAIGRIAAASRTSASKKDLAPLEKLKEKFDREYQLITGGHVDPADHKAAVERAITEHRRFLIDHKGPSAPKSDSGSLNGGPR